MVRDAEQYAEEDHKRREEAETRNEAETVIYTTERFLAENGDKVGASVKSDVEEKVWVLRAAVGGTDVAAIRDATGDLAKATSSMWQTMYAEAQAAGGPGGPGDAGGPGADGFDDVVDVEIVDEEYKAPDAEPRFTAEGATASASTVRTPPPPTSPPPSDSAAAAGRHRIFLCHSHGDKVAVRDLYRRLRADGFNPWLDEEDIFPGQDWALEIRRAMRASRLILACLSKSSITKRGFVQREIKYALELADEQPEGSIFLIPVRIEESRSPNS
jgi:hypothetical protein